MLFQKIYQIRDALLSVTDNVGHYEALNVSDKYLVWAEDAEADSVHADNQKDIQVIQGTVDYFTKEDGDINVDKGQKALAGGEGAGDEWNSVQ